MIPSVASFDVVLGKGGSGGAMLDRRVTSQGFAAVRDFGPAKDRLGSRSVELVAFATFPLYSHEPT